MAHGYPPSGVHATVGGAKGGGYVGNMTVRNCVHRYTTYANAVISARMLTTTGGNAAVDQGFPPIVIDTLDVDRCGFGVISTVGIDVVVNHRILANTGTLRATTAEPLPSGYPTEAIPLGLSANAPGANDDWASYGKITVDLDDLYSAYKKLTGTGGTIIRHETATTVYAESAALRNAVYVHAIDAVLNVNVAAIGATIMIVAPLSTTRAIVLSATGATAGSAFTILHMGVGPGSAEVRDKTSGGAVLATLAAGKWGRFTYNGTSWASPSTGSLFG